jgi:hypothetical protein
MLNQDKTDPEPGAFDFSPFPEDTLFPERREGTNRRGRNNPTDSKNDRSEAVPAPERRAKKERRRRIDPTTFEKQYTDDELEFMNAMQRFKVQSGKSFPSHGDVLRIAHSLGYRKVLGEDADLESSEFELESLPDLV